MSNRGGIKWLKKHTLDISNEETSKKQKDDENTDKS